jgi:N-acetylglucosamine transport system substrate-binding protein
MPSSAGARGFRLRRAITEKGALPLKRRIRVCVLALLLLAGCRGERPVPSHPPEESPFADQTLDLALFQGGFGEEYWKAVIDAFRADYPDAVVSYRIHPNIGELIRPAMLSGDFPDFLYHSDANADGMVAGLIQSRSLIDLTDLFDSAAYRGAAPLRSQFFPNLLDSLHFAPYEDGRIYLAPFSYGPMGLFYNQTLFERHGWTPPDTWDAFFALGEQAKAEGIALFTYPGLYPGYLESLILPAIADHAGLDALHRVFRLESGSLRAPAVLEVFEQVRRIVAEGNTLSGSFAMNHLQAQAAWMMDKALFIPNGTWIQNEMSNYDRTADFSFALTAAPGFDKAGTRYVQISYEQMMIPVGAKNPEFAKEFLRFLYSDVSVRLFAEKASSVFPLKNALETVKPYLAPEVYAMYALLENDRQETFLPSFAGTLSDSVSASELIMADFASSVLQNGQTVAAWAEGMEARFAELRGTSP